MIQGYPDKPSVVPGDLLVLRVSTDQPEFRVEFYRQGTELVSMGDLGVGVIQGSHFEGLGADQDWGWLGYDFAIPDDWTSGAYIAMFIEIDASGHEHPPDMTTAAGDSGKALFVVKNASPGSSSPILYKLSLATYHAYNFAGNGSLYRSAVWSDSDTPAGWKVSMHRPGGGTGSVIEPDDTPDFYDQSSRRQTFAHWDSHFIAWLEGNGYVVDYCTDLDVHEDGQSLLQYNLLLSVGHDEYWSESMRSNVDDFVANGGNVAFFSGDVCWWRIHFTDGNTAFTCDKKNWGPLGALDQWWVNRPENSLTGVSYRNGGGRWYLQRETLGYTVQHADHWVYEGTGLQDGDTFGALDQFPLIGYECDGAMFSYVDGFAVPTGTDGTPNDFAILGTAALGGGWQDWNGNHTATMGVSSRSGGGITFTAATTDWVRLLPLDSAVEKITRNVLDRLAIRGLRIAGPLPLLCGRRLAIRGSVATFQVDTNPLGATDPLDFAWSVSGSGVDPGDAPVVRVDIPAGGGPMTVTVTVLDHDKPIGFGTITFVPLSPEQALCVELICLLRELLESFQGTGQGVPIGPGDPAFLRGLADPIRLPPVPSETLVTMRRSASSLQQVLDRLVTTGTRRAPTLEPPVGSTFPPAPDGRLPAIVDRALTGSRSMALKLMRLNQLLERRDISFASVEALLHQSLFGVDLTIESVQPPQAWGPAEPGQTDQPVQVAFRIDNRSGSPTSGFVRAQVLYGWKQVLEGRFLQSSASVHQLASGQSAAGGFVLDRWSGFPDVAGQCTVLADYYVEDPNGMLPGALSIVHRNPSDGTQTVATWGILTSDVGSLDVYPSCRPSGPDYLDIKSFYSIPASVALDPTGSRIAPGQPITLYWTTEGAGFPASGAHPGSIGSVTLAAGPLNPPAPHPVAISGQETIDLTGLSVMAVGKPITLGASGNCGDRTATLVIGTYLPRPKIQQFDASPHMGYVNVGEKVTLTWQIANCAGNCKVQIEGFDDFSYQKRITKLTGLPVNGSVQVTPPDDTKYVLTVTGPGGSDTATAFGSLHAVSKPPAGSWWYFKMENPQSVVTKCFTVAIYAPDEASAKQMASSQNQGYAATKIDPSAFDSACPPL